MSAASPPPSGRGRVFDWPLHNPGQLNREKLIERFLIRQELLQELVRQVRLQPTGGGLRHLLCIGQRGMGKTTLLRRLCYFIEDDPELRASWHPILFAEEQYSILGLADFFRVMLQQLKCAPPESSVESTRRLMQRLDAECAQRKRRVVLLVDNLNEILGSLEELEAHELRRILQESPNLLIIGAAPTYFQQITNYDQPFYEFFRQFPLLPLSDTELDGFLRTVAEQQKDRATLQAIEGQPGRIRSLRLLTGGNPRIALFLYRMIAETPSGNIRRDLDRLIDEITPYYKHRLDALKPRQRKIVDVVARAWRPIAEAEILQQAGGVEAEAKSALRSLLDDGMLERAPDAPQAYQLAERMCNIYYLMRASQSVRQQFEWFVAFLQSFYDQEHLPALAHAWVRQWAQDWRQEEQDAPLITTAQILDQATSLGLIAQAADDPRHRVAVLAEMMRFTKLAGLSDQQSLGFISGYLRDAAVLLSNPLEKPASIRLGDSPSPPSALNPDGGNEHTRRLRAFAEIEEHRKKGRKEDALKTAQELVLDSPDEPLAWGELAICQAATGDYLGALESGQRSSALGNRALDLRFALAQSHLELGRMAEAESILDALERELAEADSHTRSNLWNLRGVLAERREQWHEAATALRKACELDPTNWHHFRNLGMICLNRLKDPGAAAEALGRAVALQPTEAECWTGLSTAHMLQRRYQEACNAAERSLELNPHQGELWANLAVARIVLQDKAGAVAAGERAVLESPESASAWINLSAAANYAADPERAEQAARRGIELHPTSVAAQVNLANAYLARGQGAEALVELTRAAALHKAASGHKTEADVWGTLATGLLSSRTWALAELALQQVVARAPERKEGWYNLGVTYVERGNHEAALAPFRRAVELDPESAESLRALGLALFRLHRLREALPILTKVQQLAPDDLSESLLISCLVAVRDVARAEELLERRLTRLPDDAEGWAQMAIVRIGQNQPEEALRHARRALELNPNHVSALTAYGIACITTQAFDEALDAYRRAARLGPGEPATWLNLATMAELKHLPLEAASALRSYFALTPGRDTDYVRLLKNLLAAGELTDAEDEFKAYLARNIQAPGDAHNMFGALCAQHGAVDRAMDAFHEAMRLDPKNPHAAYNLSSLLLRKSQPDAALEEFCRGLTINRDGANEERWMALIGAFLAKPDPKTALRLASMAQVQHPTSRRIILQLGWAQLACAQLAQAMATLGPVLEQSPESADAWLLFGWICLRIGKYDAALTALHQCLSYTDPQDFDGMQGSVLGLTQQLILAGYAAQIATLIDQASNLRLAERWMALRLALAAFLLGSLTPLAGAPQELRIAAEQLLSWIGGARVEVPANAEASVIAHEVSPEPPAEPAAARGDSGSAGTQS